jgi:hypothetical protein
MAFIQHLTEKSTGEKKLIYIYIFQGNRERSVGEVDNLASICEPTA